MTDMAPWPAEHVERVFSLDGMAALLRHKNFRQTRYAMCVLDLICRHPVGWQEHHLVRFLRNIERYASLLDTLEIAMVSAMLALARDMLTKHMYMSDELDTRFDQVEAAYRPH